MYLFFLLINPLLVLLISIFVGIHFLQSRQTRALSLTTGLVARIWFSRCRHLTSISGWEWKPPSRHCRLRPPEVITITPTRYRIVDPLKVPFMQRWALFPVSGLYLDHPLAIPVHPPLFHCPCSPLSIVSDTSWHHASVSKTFLLFSHPDWAGWSLFPGVLVLFFSVGLGCSLLDSAKFAADPSCPCLWPQLLGQAHQASSHWGLVGQSLCS